jgi:hypothetical protein
LNLPMALKVVSIFGPSTSKTLAYHLASVFIYYFS